ncbi:hypothetical protein Q7Z35_05915 [Glaesserella parasuis]|nr:hypothetical protein [Glaesserella parasuis]
MKRDISRVIKQFDDESKDIKHRYYSFDFCYAHFRHSKETGHMDIEKSCFVLWSYLASWGMLRGSSFLMQRNPAYLTELVKWIYEQPQATWLIDVEDYPNKTKEVLSLYIQVKSHLIGEKKHQAVTLVTKVLLGVFAIIPAYDRFFKDTFSEIAGEECGFSTPNETSLNIIAQFYQENKEEIDTLSKSHQILDFDGKPTNYRYSKAKIIDMYGFQIGRDKVSED